MKHPTDRLYPYQEQAMSGPWRLLLYGKEILTGTDEGYSIVAGKV